MFDLKPLAPEAIPRAIEKAERYRFLNEPNEAESICLDVLEVEPENQQAIVVLILALTDQFDEGGRQIKDARALVERLSSEYEREYYEGIVHERFAKSQLAKQAHPVAWYDWLHTAMKCYERAERLRPAGNDDAILRWNTCARILQRTPALERGLHATPDFLE